MNKRRVTNELKIIHIFNVPLRIIARKYLGMFAYFSKYVV